MTIDVRALSADDDRSRFTSGNESLDRFFRRFAGQNQFRHHIGTTYVAVEDSRILGYATVSVAHIEGEDVPKRLRKRLPRYPLPVLRLARLAVHLDAQGRRIGERLLRAVFLIAHQIRRQAGCLAVVVDAKPDAVAFCERYGFAPLAVDTGASDEKPQPVPMWIPLSEIPDPTGGE